MKNNQDEQKRRKKMFDVFDHIQKKGVGTLIIGGDFFDYWFEYNNKIPSGYENLLEALKNLKKSGIDIHYVLGNHDYWDFGYLKKKVGIIFHREDLHFKFNKQNSCLKLIKPGISSWLHTYSIFPSILSNPSNSGG